METQIKEDSDHFYGGKEIRADADPNDEDEVIVQLDNLHKTYLLGLEGVPALRGVSLSIKRGEFVVIFGLSGGGKTTLLNVLGTIDKPTKGEMRLCGVRITSKTEDSVFSQLRLKKIGFVFQTFNLLSSMTALENVEMPMILAGELSSAERRSRAIELLNSVGMGPRLHHHPSQLSGGEQQRVTIARSMANEPEILLLDEPTGDLDTLNTAIVMKLLTDLNRKKKITLIMVTHDVGLKNFADRIVWMRDGKIVRVEKVHPKIQMERFEELDAEIVALSSGHKRMAKVNDPGNNTVLRQPQDYATHPEHVRRETERFNFSVSRADASMTQDEFERQTGLRPAQDILPPPRAINVRASNSGLPSLVDDVLVDVPSLSDSGSLDPSGSTSDPIALV